MDDDEWDGERIRRLRRMLRMTQATLGKMLGVHRRTVSGWENGRSIRDFTPYHNLVRLEDEVVAKFRRQTTAFFAEHVEMVPNAYVRCTDVHDRYVAWWNPNKFPPDAHVRMIYRPKDFAWWCTHLGLRVEQREGNEVFAGLLLRGAGKLVQPDEPPEGPGPSYGTIGGKLTIVAHSPDEGEVDAQRRLHERLRAKATQLTAALANAGNQYAELMRAAEDYADLLKPATDAIDVVSLWSVGGSLHALMAAYEQQQINRTLAPPLEPQMAAALTTLVRDHGAFILGFKEGRELVERADTFLLQRDLIEEIKEPGDVLLRELASNADLIEEKARQVHSDIRDALHAAGWGTGRTTYAGYLTIRNAFRVIIKASVKVSVGRDVNLASVGAAVLTYGALTGDPHLQFLHTAVPVLQHHAAQLLSFFKHSPEFRAYVEWALHTLENDRRGRQ